MGRAVEVWELTGREFDEGRSKVAVVPVGSVERHGDHLPLGTDAIEAQWVARRVAEELGADLFPPIWYGVSPGLARFPGTINVSQQAFIAYVTDVLREVARNGYRLVVVINGHGGNTPALRAAIKDAAASTDAAYALFDWWRDAGREALARLFRSPGHAGEDETSAMLYIDGAHVRMEYASPHALPPELSRVYSSVYVESRRVEELYYPRAVLGDPTAASAERGREWLEAVVRDIVARVRDLMAVLGL